MRPSEKAALVSLAVGAAAVWGSYALGLGELAGWIPWVVGLLVFGSFFGGLIQAMGDAANADREWERDRDTREGPSRF